MLVTPDFSEVAEEITPGTYRVLIKKGEVKAWPSGEQYVNWEMETFGESEPRNNGRRIFHKTSTSGKGAFQLQRLYKAATGRVLTGAFDTEQLAGKQIVVEVVEGVNRQTGEKTGYNDIKAIRPLT